MRKIEKPLINQNEVCSSISDFKFTDRVIIKSENYRYDYKRSAELVIDEIEFGNSNIEYFDYMKSIYSNRFSNNRYKESYIYYKKIRDSENCCPYCGFISRRVSQLDHFLPKSIYPVHSITVDNLVPICIECNNNKKSYCSTSEQSTILHPYFDEVLIEINDFLKCKIIEEYNIGFEFYIEKLVSWDDIIYERVVTHFDLFKIEDLYRSEFEADFSNLISELRLHYEMRGSLDDMLQILQIKKQALERSNNKPWILAGVKSLISNQWFIYTYLPKKILESDWKVISNY